MSSPLAKKLQIKAGQTIAVLNAPPGYDDALGLLPADVRQSDKLEGQLGFVQVFVKKKQELDSVVPAVLRALKEDGLLWVSYPKGGSKVDTDLQPRHSVGSNGQVRPGWSIVGLHRQCVVGYALQTIGQGGQVASFL